MTNPADILAAIANGDCDDHLFEINRACKQRLAQTREEKAETVRAAITVGTRVRLTGIKPRYMDGSWATVVKINQTRAVVNLDHERGKWRGDIAVPLSCLVSLDRVKELQP